MIYIILFEFLLTYLLQYTILNVICHENTHMTMISSDITDLKVDINHNIPSYERQALYDLYNSTNGNDWIYQDGAIGYWNFTDPQVNPCLVSNPWQGLNCTLPTSSSGYYYISEILLSGYNLNGYLPDSIGNFTYLQYLDLSYNYISQTIPNTIGNLTELVEFDLSYNSLNGSLPNSIYELSALQVLNLDSNYHLQGTLSDLLGQLSQLQYFNLRYNLFKGTIPSTIGNLSETLTYLRLSANQFTGTIPNNIRKLKYLYLLYLSNNQLRGTIPNSIGELSILTYLSLSSNKLSGTIPTSLCNLTSLNTLSLSTNQLTGIIPNSIGNLTFLTYLALDFNNLSGTIPSSLSNLINIYTLGLSINKLTGTIPSWIGELSLLKYLFLGDNQLSGTIPSGLFNLTSLNVFDVGYNQISGIVPDYIGKLSFLTYLSFDTNQLSGTIPSTLSNLTCLSSLSLNTNHLTGIIPNSIGKLTSLTTLGIEHNLLYGIIPSSLTDLFKLEQLYLSYNILSGSVPNLFNNLTQLSCIVLNNNYLTGTLPESISQLKNLSYLFIQNNHFSGSLDKAFNATNQKQLNNIQLSNNQFTGKLPEQVFLSHSLIAFSAVSNCFHGSIPSSVCDNANLVSLALDGLACASSCQNKIIPGLSLAYISENEIGGGIPECLWSMANLTVLHLSGNSLTGSLPDNIKLNSTLKDLSLSYNILTGNIPSFIQERAWDNLDLSHNRILGTLRSNYANQYKKSSLSLENNRLSGSIPKHLRDMRNISILEGNYYECKYDRSDLPTHDDHRDTYECGSNVFNVLYYIWLGSVLILCSGIVLAWYYHKLIDEYIPLSALAQNIWKWIQIIEYLIENSHQPIPEKYIYFKAYNAIHEIISSYSLFNAIFIIAILLPVYAILSYYYSTHTYEYAWTVSILYLSGNIAFGIAISILLVFIIGQVFIFYYSIQRSTYKLALMDMSEEQQKQSKKEFSNQIADEKKYSQSLWKTLGMYVLYIAVNIAIVSGANVAYVYAVLYQSNQIIVLCQILLSIFKMIWNSIISPKMVYWIINYLSIQNSANSSAVQQRLFMLQFIVSLLNNIIVPCFVVAIVSPNCFYHVFQQEPDVTSTFQYSECAVIDNENKECIEYITSMDSTSYSPPFSYSYQCSSDFVTYYAPVFVLMGFISFFIVPLIQLGLFKILLRYSRLSKYIKLNKLFYLEKSEVESPLLAIDDIYELLVSILTTVGLLLTFGVVFPPLAIVFMTVIYRRIYYHKAIIGRYISYMMELKAYACLDIIEEDCKVIPLLSTLQVCGWILISVSCMFYTLFLFDILGDEVGLYKSYWVLIVIPCIPICIYNVYRLCNLFLYKPTDIKQNILDTDIELSAIATISNPLFLNTISNAINSNDQYNNYE